MLTDIRVDYDSLQGCESIKFFGLPPDNLRVPYLRTGAKIGNISIPQTFIQIFFITPETKLFSPSLPLNLSPDAFLECAFLSVQNLSALKSGAEWREGCCRSRRFVPRKNKNRNTSFFVLKIFVHCVPKFVKGFTHHTLVAEIFHPAKEPLLRFAHYSFRGFHFDKHS